MPQRPSATASLPKLFDAARNPPPLLSYPLESGPLIVSSDPEFWARQTAWDVREHDLDRFLEAQHGAKIEDFWTRDFIQARGRKYCELLLKYIIMFNHEEVGGHAVMLIDEIALADPALFASMMQTPVLENIFGLDQIEFWGRKLCQMIMIWCKSAYEANKQYWDKLHFNPPTGEELLRFKELLNAQYKPQKLKAMNIVPKEREDDWPCHYFARARAKGPVPWAGMASEVESATGVRTAPEQLKDAESSQQSTNSSQSNANAVSSQSTSSDKGKSKSTVSSTGGTVGGIPGGNDGSEDPEDNRPPNNLPPQPQSPKGKKAEQSKKDDDKKLETTDAPDRRTTSENNTLVKREGLSLADWMTAPGAERRAVSSEAQSKLLQEQGMGRKGSGQHRVPNTGRGGAQAAIGRYQYQPGSAAPHFIHPYTPDAIAQNNAAYLYHQDHSFGRAVPLLPDHATTYRPGSNIYQAVPQRGNQPADMFNQMAHPQTHFSYPPHMQAGTYNQTGAYGPPQSAHQMVHGGFPGQSPHMMQMGPMGQMMQSPQVMHVQTAPHGVVPNHIMDPYIQLAASGVQPQPGAPLSQVGQTPRFPGYPPMRQPVTHTMRAPSGGSYTPMQGHASVHASPRPSMQQQIMAVRSGSGMASSPHPASRSVRRDMIRSEPVQYSPQAPSFQPGGAYRQNSYGIATMTPRPAPQAITETTNRPNRAPTAPRGMPRHASGSGDTQPFPSYLDEYVNTANLPESQQCTSDTIGPDAEDVVTLWFADIPVGSEVDELKAVIEEKVPVADIKNPIVYDLNTNFERGWTFVRFLSNQDARTALAHFPGYPFKGGNLKVQVPERRTQEGALRARNNSKSYQGHPRGQSSDTFTAPRGSFGTGSTPVRPPPFHQQAFGTTPGPRRSRGNSLSQANQAVRRNSAFTKQDARSDLPLPGLPEVSEPSKPATPVPEPAVSTEETPVDESKVPGKKKKGKPKRKPKNRDESLAPSESNISSVAEASGVSRSPSVVQPVAHPVAEPAIESAIASTAETIAEPTKAPELAPAPRTSTWASIASGETLVELSLHAGSETVDSEDHERNAEVDSTIVTQDHDRVDQVDGATALGTAEAEKPIETGIASTAPVEVDVDAGPALTETSIPVEHPAIETGELDTVSSVGGLSDNRSEATTVPQEQSTGSSKKTAKIKGPAQTQSMSGFPSKKQQRLAKLQAKKQKAQEKRIASNASTTSNASKGLSAAADQITDPADAAGSENALTQGVVAGPSDANAKGKGKGKGKAPDTEQHGAVDSSSMAGTPDTAVTAREYPGSSPGTPTPKPPTTTLATEGTQMQDTQAEGSQMATGTQTPMEDAVTSGDATPGETTNRRRSTLEGTFHHDPTDFIAPSGVLGSQPQSYLVPSEASQNLSTASGPAPAPIKKAVTSSAAVPKTYAQAMKGTKNTNVTTATTTNETGLGLSERDVNVQR